MNHSCADRIHSLRKEKKKKRKNEGNQSLLSKDYFLGTMNIFEELLEKYKVVFNKNLLLLMSRLTPYLISFRKTELNKIREK